MYTELPMQKLQIALYKTKKNLIKTNKKIKTEALKHTGFKNKDLVNMSKKRREQNEAKSR